MALAPQPPAPVRGYSFTDWQIANPTLPPPGDRLDGEYDRTNTSVDGLIDWVASSLNTDGTLRPGVVGEAQLASGLFDDVAQHAVDEVQPYVAAAQSSAMQALASANAAATSKSGAEAQNVAAQQAKTAAQTAGNLAELARIDAQTSAATAGTKATDAGNAANHAAGDAALASNWGIVSRDWAEHMPDTIPPNTLAVMGVSGDHWSSRWWANRAGAAVGSFLNVYLGASATPPVANADGTPLMIGAIYYNTTTHLPYVWTGTDWEVFYAPAKTVQMTLVYSAAAAQTNFPLTTLDLAGHSWIISGTLPEPVDVHVDGLLLREQEAGGLWHLDAPTSTVVFTTGRTLGQIVAIEVLASPASLTPILVRSSTQALLPFDIDPLTEAAGQIDGVRTLFKLTIKAPPHAVVTTATSQEVLISVDGVLQQPGTDYIAAGGDILFNEAPQVGAVTWGYYYGPSAVLDPNVLPDPIPGNHTFSGDVTVMGDLAFSHGVSPTGIALESGVVGAYINDPEGVLAGPWKVDTLTDTSGRAYYKGDIPAREYIMSIPAAGTYQFPGVVPTAMLVLVVAGYTSDPLVNYTLELWSGEPGIGGSILLYQATGITSTEFEDKASFFTWTSGELWLRVTPIDLVAVVGDFYVAALGFTTTF